MKFATIGHLLDENTRKQLPQAWIHQDIVLSPEIDVLGTKGHISGILITAKDMMSMPIEDVRNRILKTALLLHNTYHVDVIQLGAYTTSVTNGGTWLTQQKPYTGFVNHGDSYTAAVTCQAVHKAATTLQKDLSACTLAIVGAYGIIGEAASKLLVPHFAHSILIGRTKEKFKPLEDVLTGSFETTVSLTTTQADIIVTATNHPTTLLEPKHLKKHAIVIDVSQPPNLGPNISKTRPDVTRIDGGIVDFPGTLPIPGIPAGKNFACIAEAMMQALENDRANHVGSIDLNHLKQTETWAKKYGFTLNELTNFGQPIPKK
jgi:predicted amino acid dehydrogenase